MPCRPLAIATLAACLGLVACAAPPASVIDGDSGTEASDAAPPAIADASSSLDASRQTGGPDATTAQADASSAGPDAGRDWSQHPAIVQLDTTQDLWALGDVHGDYDRMTALLAAAGIAPVPAQPSAAQWSAGGAVLVCTGDLIDKWTQSLPVLAYLQALASSATASGGQVIVTMGNHEAEFLADPSGTKTADFVTELNAAGISPASVASGAHPLGQYLRALPFAARVNDWFFAHAGNTSGATLANLEASLRAGVDAYGYGAPILSDANSILEYKLDSPAPWWEVAGKDPATVLAQYATAVSATHIVEGHQPGSVTFSDGTKRAKGTLFQKFGEIFLIDVGMSRGVDDSAGALLHIQRNAATGKTTASVVLPSGASSVLWSN